MTDREEAAGVELPLSEKQQIDRVCIEFEDCWRAADTPQLESYLSPFEGRRRAALLRELLLIELAYLSSRGEQPTREAYLKRFPEDADILTAVFVTGEHDTTPIYELGARVGSYCIEGFLGSGSFAEVYLATNSASGERVAIKVLARHRFASANAVEHFLDEARTARKLDHPTIVRALDVLRDDAGRPFIVMPYINGQSLRQRLDAGGVSRSQAICWVAQLAEAIDFAHRGGIVHRDLEPRNILLDDQDRPHITDFGLAVDERSQDTRAGESAGSWGYMSPEQIRGESHWLDGRADIWALGVILYEVLTGRRPFAARTVELLADQILGREAKPLRQIDGEISAELERITLKCLQKSVADRYATAQDLAADLKRVNRTSDHPLRLVRRISQALRRSEVAVPMVLGTTLAALVFMALCVVAGPQRNRSPEAGAAPTGPPLIGDRHVAAAADLGQPASLVVEDITIAVWVPKEAGDQRRGQINRSESSASPLQLGDKIRLSVSVSEPSYVYILWLDPDGQLLPVYPWKNGSWLSEPDGERPVRQLILPSAVETWTIEPGESGAATLFVFASRDRFGGEASFASLLPDCQSQVGEPLRHTCWFENGREVGATRAPGLDNPTSLADPVLLNQRLLFERLGPHFDGNAAICIPIDVDRAAECAGLVRDANDDTGECT